MTATASASFSTSDTPQRCPSFVFFRPEDDTDENEEGGAVERSRCSPSKVERSWWNNQLGQYGEAEETAKGDEEREAFRRLSFFSFFSSFSSGCSSFSLVCGVVAVQKGIPVGKKVVVSFSDSRPSRLFPTFSSFSSSSFRP